MNLISIPSTWMTVFTDSTTYEFIPATAWQKTMPGLNQARRTMETRGRVGTLNIQAAIQVANDINNPGTGFTAIGSAITGSAVNMPGAATTVDLEGYNYVRGGWAIKVTSGNGAITVSGRIDLWQ